MIGLTDLIDRFGAEELAHLTDRANAEVIDETVINQAIADAEGEVESYLNAVGLVSRNNRGRLIYLDDQTPPKALTLKACDIARYYLHEDGVTDIVQKRYDNAIAWLKEVKKDKTVLTGLPDPSEAGNGKDGFGGVVVMPNPTPSNWID